MNSKLNREGPKTEHQTMEHNNVLQQQNDY